MTWIDADADPSTFDSTSSNLTLPAGASVLFAGLYYGGRLTAGTGGSPPPNAAARNTVLFKAPGDTGYRTLTASQVDGSSTPSHCHSSPAEPQRSHEAKLGRRFKSCLRD